MGVWTETVQVRHVVCDGAGRHCKHSELEAVAKKKGYYLQECPDGRVWVLCPECLRETRRDYRKELRWYIHIYYINIYIYI
jgi:hypothetical protein